ncbi:hypothetical protein D9619_009845 [Psilocybe cf. subviscida]|uniref:TauD/TfdA-like domain-containing protein n=1 Tax=Psilocybe cf. subviscida TaxID=2480587 RepID=A0A8H5F686_9AGAR|nr:hypothetical protein D9619_009845 [Psilocybe cf. subviscida]
MMPSRAQSLLRRSTARSCAALTPNSGYVTRLSPPPRAQVCQASQQRTWTTLTRGREALTVHALNDTPFPYVWLRDSCQAPSSVHPSTRQKLHRTSDVPVDVQPAPGGDSVHVRAGTSADGKEEGEAVSIVWKDGHESVYTREFLERYAIPGRLEAFHGDEYLRERAWTRADIERVPGLYIDYEGDEGVQDTDAGLLRAMTHLAQYGLLFVRGVPHRETSDKRCELRVLAERFGEIRPTFYGLLWDVVNLRESRNIAYTNLDLGMHMDLLYFQHPPRYQILHCLRNQVIGGTSIFVDGLHAARTLRETHPEYFDTLTKTPVSFHYINDGHHLHHEHHTIELDTRTGEISHINYSPPFQAPLPLNTPAEFYPALKEFARLLNDPQHTYEYTLKEGDAVVFDNRRVLHARTAFRDKPGDEGKDEETNRWLKGCYLEADALLDRMRVLRRLESSSER